jgi:polyhydroxyalkanoate synthesis regulator phasin
VTGSRPNGRALKPNQHERIQRETVIDNLIGRALRGALTIPEAALLAEYWRQDRRIGEKTRRRLTDTTQALQRHREAADAEIRRLEQQVAELTGQQQEAAA